MIELLSSLDSNAARTVVAAPGAGEGFWAGAPSAVAAEGTVWLAYRLRRPLDQGRGYANVVARAGNGFEVRVVAAVTSAQFECASLERPALVQRPDGGWRLYVSCSTPGSKHWWVEALDAETPAELPTGRRTVVLAGDAGVAWKDVVVKCGADGWQMWACRHPLDGGEAAADRMSTWYATSDDGLRWTMVAEALSPVPDTWCARGARLSDVLHDGNRWWALFDGRKSAAENWRERCGIASGSGPEHFAPVAGPVPGTPGPALRYACAVPTPGGLLMYFEATGPDGSHDLRAVLTDANGFRPRH